MPWTAVLCSLSASSFMNLRGQYEQPYIPLDQTEEKEAKEEA